MIRAVIFDLDGTLVQTERLKATSYARAALELCPYAVSEEEVVEAYKDVVGLSRHEVASALVERFGLERASRAQMDDYGVSAPWQAFVQVRLGYYEDMISDPELRDFIDLLHVYPTMAEALKIIAISRYKDPARLTCCAQ